MRAGFLRRLEKDKLEWYKSRGLKPPNAMRERQPRQKKSDTATYTRTTVLNSYAPNAPEIRVPFSYWEGDGAGIEPVEFRQSICALRSTNVVSPYPLAMPKTGRLNECFTPYENDIMSFDAFETARKELKHRSEHLAREMERVQEDWTRPPKEKWFCEKDETFTREHCKFMEIFRRNQRKQFRASKRKRAK